MNNHNSKTINPPIPPFTKGGRGTHPVDGSGGFSKITALLIAIIFLSQNIAIADPFLNRATSHESRTTRNSLAPKSVFKGESNEGEKLKPDTSLFRQDQKETTLNLNSLDAQARIYYSNQKKASALCFSINPLGKESFYDAMVRFIDKFNTLKIKIKESGSPLAPYIDDLLHIYKPSELHIIVAASQKYGFPTTERIINLEKEFDNTVISKMQRINEDFKFKGNAEGIFIVTPDRNVILKIDDNSPFAMSVKGYRNDIPKKVPEMGDNWKQIEIVHVTISRININAIKNLDQNRQLELLGELEKQVKDFVSANTTISGELKINNLRLGHWKIPGWSRQGADLIDLFEKTGTAPVLAAKGRGKVSPAQLLDAWFRDEKLRGKVLTVGDFLKLKSDFSESTLRVVLKSLVDLGLVKSDKSEEPRKFWLTDIIQRAPPDVIQAIAGIKGMDLSNIPEAEILDIRNWIIAILRRAEGFKPPDSKKPIEPEHGDLELEIIKRDLKSEQQFGEAFKCASVLSSIRGYLAVYCHKKTGLKVVRKFCEILHESAISDLMEKPVQGCCPVFGFEEGVYYGMDRGYYYEIDLRPFGYVELRSVITKAEISRRRCFIKALMPVVYNLSKSGFVHGHLFHGNILVNTDTGRIKIIDYKYVRKDSSIENALVENLYDLYNRYGPIAAEELFRFFGFHQPAVLADFYKDINSELFKALMLVPKERFDELRLHNRKDLDFYNALIQAEDSSLAAGDAVDIVSNAKSQLSKIPGEIEQVLREDPKGDETEQLLWRIAANLRKELQSAEAEAGKLPKPAVPPADPRELEGVESAL